MNSITMQCKIEVLRIFRNPYFVFWSLLMPIVFYFIFTNIVNADVPDVELWQAHYLMSMTAFSVMGSAIMTFGIRMVQERTQGWSSFMKITPLPAWAYFTAKMFGQTVMHLFSVILIFIAGYLINGVSLTFTQGFFSGLWILVASLPFLAIGTLVGSMKKVETASGVSNILYLALAILGGMWFPIYIFPTFLQDMAEWLPSYHFGNGAWEIIRGNAPSIKSVLILGGYLIGFMVISALVRRNEEAN